MTVGIGAKSNKEKAITFRSMISTARLDKITGLS